MNYRKKLAAIDLTKVDNDAIVEQIKKSVSNTEHDKSFNKKDSLEGVEKEVFEKESDNYRRIFELVQKTSPEAIEKPKKEPKKEPKKKPKKESRKKPKPKKEPKEAAMDHLELCRRLLREHRKKVSPKKKPEPQATTLFKKAAEDYASKIGKVVEKVDDSELAMDVQKLVIKQEMAIKELIFGKRTPRIEEDELTENIIVNFEKKVKPYSSKTTATNDNGEKLKKGDHVKFGQKKKRGHIIGFLPKEGDIEKVAIKPKGGGDRIILKLNSVMKNPPTSDEWWEYFHVLPDGSTETVKGDFKSEQEAIDYFEQHAHRDMEKYNLQDVGLDHWGWSELSQEYQPKGMIKSVNGIAKVASEGFADERRYSMVYGADENVDFVKERHIYADESVDENRCPSGTVVQSLVFNKKEFSQDTAKKWAQDHNYLFGKVDETDQYYRLRQHDPTEFEKGSFRTIEFDNNIQAVIACPKSNPVYSDETQQGLFD